MKELASLHRCCQLALQTEKPKHNRFLSNQLLLWKKRKKRPIIMEYNIGKFKTFSDQDLPAAKITALR
jgi:hypothetical protein